MSTFLCGFPELFRRTFTLSVFRLSCLCASYCIPTIPDVSFGSAFYIHDCPIQSGVIETVQFSKILCYRVTKIFADPTSISECVYSIDSFAGMALKSSYDALSYVDFYERENFLKCLFSDYKGVHFVNGFVDIVCFRLWYTRDFVPLEILSKSNPRIDAAKVFPSLQ